MDNSTADGPVRSKSAVLVTLQVWARQFKPDRFHVTGESMFCSTCNVPSNSFARTADETSGQSCSYTESTNCGK